MSYIAYREKNCDEYIVRRYRMDSEDLYWT